MDQSDMLTLAVQRELKQKRDETRALLEEAIRVLQKEGKRNFRDLQIFILILGDGAHTRERFVNFLHDVATCPKEVIDWCQNHINLTNQT